MIYKGKLAQLYDILFGDINEDLEFYKYFIKNNSGIALEIGSGTGRLILNYLSIGLHVDGLEKSIDMINICVQKAKTLNLQPLIYNQELENLSINKKYKTVFLPLYIFQNLLSKDKAINSLKNIYKILDTNGQILISIFKTNLKYNSKSWEVTNITRDNNSEVILSEFVRNDKSERIQHKHIKHEIYFNNILKETLLSQISFKHYSKSELNIMLKQAGFKNIQIFGDYTLQKVTSENNIYIFSATK